jgi:hypothetical protein
MARPKRNPLDFGFGQRSFAQRFILAEILGPPRGRSHAPAAPGPPGGGAGSGKVGVRPARGEKP